MPKFFIINEIWVKLAQNTIEYEKSLLVRNQKKEAFCYCFFMLREGAYLSAFKLITYRESRLTDLEISSLLGAEKVKK